jgi:hypothetical protein
MDHGFAMTCLASFFAWGALALKLRVALREALCACALQIIMILNKLRVFLPVNIRN